MSNIFGSVHSKQVERFDLKLAEKDRFTKMMQEKHSLSLSGSMHLYRLPEQEVRRSIEANTPLIQEVQRRMITFDFPHLVLLTDITGMVLHICGTENVIREAQGYRLSRGTSFSIEHAGLNAVSAAMELNRPVIIKGEEHTLDILKGWS